MLFWRKNAFFRLKNEVFDISIFSRKTPKFECYSGFHGWGIDWKHYFQRLDGPQTQKLRIFTFSLQTLAKIRKNRKNLTINDVQNINFRDKNTRILQN